MIFGKIGEQNIVALQGRNHFYEGHSMDTVVFPVRVLALLGVEVLILTNSAGGISDGMEAGDFMIISDHINLAGTNPLIGPNIKEFGPRFPDMTEAYDPKLTNLLESVMKKNKVRFHRGVYAGLTGPTYETPAEVRYLKIIGCSAVGMSTVSECIAANHMGLRVAAVSCISNLAAGIAKHKLTHTEVTETGKRVEKDFTRVIREFVTSIPG
jgi:purine-nucleoside phosphorylase